MAVWPLKCKLSTVSCTAHKSIRQPADARTPRDLQCKLQLLRGGIGGALALDPQNAQEPVCCTWDTPEGQGRPACGRFVWMGGAGSRPFCAASRLLCVFSTARSRTPSREPTPQSGAATTTTTTTAHRHTTHTHTTHTHACTRLFKFYSARASISPGHNS